MGLFVSSCSASAPALSARFHWNNPICYFHKISSSAVSINQNILWRELYWDFITIWVQPFWKSDEFLSPLSGREGKTWMGWCEQARGPPLKPARPDRLGHLGQSPPLHIRIVSPHSIYNVKYVLYKSYSYFTSASLSHTSPADLWTSLLPSVHTAIYGLPG